MSRPSWLSLFYIHIALSILCCVYFCLWSFYVLCIVLPISLNCPFLIASLYLYFKSKYIEVYAYLHYLHCCSPPSVIGHQSRFCPLFLGSLVFLLPQLFNYLAFKYYGFERTWRMFFQKQVMRTKFYIYVFIILGKTVNINRRMSIWNYFLYVGRLYCELIVCMSKRMISWLKIVL